MKKALQAPMDAERLDTLDEMHSRKDRLVEVSGRDYFDMIDALRISRAALTELAGIQDWDGWTQNMGARVALHKLDGRL